MKKLILTLYIFLVIVSGCSPKVTNTSGAETQTVSNTVIKEEFRKKAPSPGPAPKINISEAETLQLENGLRIIIVENHKIPQVSFQLRLVNDPVREGSKVGKVSMTADILSRGTAQRTKAEIDESIDFIGGSIFSNPNGIFANSLTKHKDQLLDIMTDILYHPSFPEGELEKMKTQYLSSLESSKTDPNAIASNVKSYVSFGPDHPYGEIQNPDHVSAIEMSDLKEHYNSYYVPSNAYLIIVGDINKKEVQDIAKKYFAKWSGATVKPPRKRTVKMPEATNVSFSNKDGAVQSVVIVSNPVALKPGDPDAIPASVMNAILGTGFSGRLNLNLREDKAYTYGAGSSLRPDVLTGTFNASASMRNEVTDSSIIQILYELNRIRTEPVNSEELQKMKNYLTGSFARALESPQTIARFAYNIARYNLAPDYYQTYLEKLNAVTAEDVRAMATKYIHPEKAHIVVVGNQEEVADKMIPFDADGEIDYYDAFANEIVISEMPLPANVTADDIIEDYIDAMGGRDLFDQLKSLYVKMSADAMGQEMIIESFQEGDAHFCMKLGNGQMVFQEQKFDGTKAVMSAMGQNQVFTEGPQFEEIKSGAKVIPQRFYKEEGTRIELKSIEQIEEESAYKIIATAADGSMTTEYYNVTNGLFMRMVKTQAGPQGPVTIQTDFADYRDTGDGLMFPYVTRVTGLLPGGAVMEMKVVELKRDETFAEGTFDIK